MKTDRLNGITTNDRALRISTLSLQLKTTTYGDKDMGLQDQRNQARDRNKINKKFIQGLQDFMGNDWKLQYKCTSKKLGSGYLYNMYVRIENNSYYCFLHFPDFRLSAFDVNTFDTYLRHFNNMTSNGIRKDFYEKFLKYKEVINLYDNLEIRLTTKADKPKALKV